MKKDTIKDCIYYANLKDGKCLDTIYINNLTKMNWECKEKHIFQAIFKTVKKGHWCAECAGVKKLTHEYVNSIVNKKDGELLSTYENSRNKVQIKCNKDQYIWSTTWDNIKADHWCPKCVDRAPVKIEYIKQFVQNKDGIVIDATDYRTAKSTITIQCNKDKHIWNTNWDCLKQGNWCPRCAGKILLTYKEFEDFIVKKDGLIIAGNSSFRHDDKFTIQCLKDKYIWTTSYYALVYKETWCPKCAKNVLLTFDEVKQIVLDKGGILKATPSDLQNNLSKLTVDCGNKHIWKISYANLINNNRWCPVCINYHSQKKLLEIVEDITQEECIFNFKGFDWLRNKRNLEIDIWTPKIKLAVEYDGIHHFKPINYYGDINIANEKFKERQKMDRLKDKLISMHPEEIKYFVRINYNDELTKENILKKLPNCVIKERL